MSTGEGPAAAAETYAALAQQCGQRAREALRPLIESLQVSEGKALSQGYIKALSSGSFKALLRL